MTTFDELGECVVQQIENGCFDNNDNENDYNDNGQSLGLFIYICFDEYIDLFCDL